MLRLTGLSFAGFVALCSEPPTTTALAATTPPRPRPFP